MAARGIMNGVGNGLFAPDSNVTRAQYVTMLMRMTDYNMTDYDPMPFPDLEPGSWYYESVCKAAASGAVRGNSDGLFEPHEAIDRQEIFAITYEVLTGFYLIFPGDGDEDALAGFSDASSVAPEYLKAVSEIVRNGLAQGSNGSLRPEAYLSRAEAAQFLANVVRCIVPDYTEFLKDNK
ncbi:MAG: S-layer homology domain-containing protein [Oscillospiraceae bacterium]|nr:S-layer homology domain-containing protein [Oscillospiraceae bacterium]